jgi:hypothetical protein
MTNDHDPSLDELFVALGNEILSGSKMGTSVSTQQKYTLGKSWFENHLTEIKSAVCSNKLVKDLADTEDTAALVTALTPLLGFSATATSIGIIATLLVRIGVRRICSDH